MKARTARQEHMLVELGNVGWIAEIIQDIRYGARSLAKTPAFTVVAVLSLVLGIGANTAMFTVLNLLRPVVIAEPATFVFLPNEWSQPAYEQLRIGASAFSDVIALSREVVLIAPAAPADEPLSTSVELVSANFFTSLRAPMALGRSFGADADDSNSRDVGAVLNYRFWKSRFAGDSAILGRVIPLASGVSLTVLGVTGRDFTGTRRGGPDMWLPLGVRASLPAVFQPTPPRAGWRAMTHGWLTVYGRLAPGRSIQEARTQADVALRQLAAADSAFAPGLPRPPFSITTAADAGDFARESRFVNAMILAATLIVLLVACFNVASLMLARAAHRRREIALRICLGASRSRLVRQLITESAIIAGLGGALALVLAIWTLRVVALSGGFDFITDDDPERLARLLAPDAGLFAFALALATLSVMAFGLVPALQATRLDLASGVRGGQASGGSGAGSSRLRSGLVMTQVALSLVLLISAGVLTRSLMRALSLGTGFERTRVLDVSTTARLSGYDSVRTETFSRQLEERLAATPGVRSVAHGDVPLVGGRWRATLTPQRAPGVASATPVDGYMAAITPSFFATLGIPIVRGRSFDDAELRTRAQVVVVSEATARTLWPNEDPLGKLVQVSPGQKARLAPETVLASAVVVGVARDAQMLDLGKIPPVYVYVPSASARLLVGTAGNPSALTATVRAVARTIDPNVFVSVTPLDERITTNGDIPTVKSAASLAGGIGVLALLLTAVGIFGLLAYSVAQRTRELGIRMALGARAGDVIGLVVREGLLVLAVGGLVGLLAGAVATRLLSALLFGMSPLDPIAYGGVTAVIVLVTLVSCYIPARRATRVDPLVALKAE